MWLGAVLAGREFAGTSQLAADASIGVVFRRMAIEQAWGQELAPVWFPWPLFIGLAVFTWVVFYICFQIMFAKRWGIKDRSVLGVDAEAGFESKNDIVGLEADWPLEGRFLLGEFHGRTLATETGSEAEKSLRSFLHSPRTYGRGCWRLLVRHSAERLRRCCNFDLSERRLVCGYLGASSAGPVGDL